MSDDQLKENHKELLEGAGKAARERLRANFILLRIAELEKQTATKRSGPLQFKVGEKGGVSVYGLGRFPVTLYYEQWIRLLDASGELREFLEENKSHLKLKPKE